MATAKKTSVIVADDDPEMREVVIELMESHYPDQYEFTQAENGLEVLQMLNEKGAYDILISDYDMPFMNGKELLSCLDVILSIRSGQIKLGKIAMMSGSEENLVHLTEMKKTFPNLRLFSKPFSFDDLLNALK